LLITSILKTELFFPTHCRTLIRQPFLGKGIASIDPTNALAIGRRAVGSSSDPEAHHIGAEGQEPGSDYVR
jgi:hypothetical protein